MNTVTISEEKSCPDRDLIVTALQIMSRGDPRYQSVFIARILLDLMSGVELSSMDKKTIIDLSYIDFVAKISSMMDKVQVHRISEALAMLDQLADKKWGENVVSDLTSNQLQVRIIRIMLGVKSTPELVSKLSWCESNQDHPDYSDALMEVTCWYRSARRSAANIPELIGYKWDGAVLGSLGKIYLRLGKLDKS